MPLHCLPLTGCLHESGVRTQGDYDLLLQYYDKVMQYPRNIRALRKRAHGLGKDHPAYGLPAGTENGDMYNTAIGCGTTYGEKAEMHNYDGVITGDTVLDCHTTVPKYDIAFDTVRCFQALGPVLQKVGAKHSRPDITSEGKKLSQEAVELLEEINTSLDRVAIHNLTRRGEKGGNLTCYPTWPGAGKCGGGHESWGGAAGPTSSAVCKLNAYKYPSLDMCGGGCTACASELCSSTLHSNHPLSCGAHDCMPMTALSYLKYM